jgi:hypothetical protein
MMCFRDRTYCASSTECANNECGRRFTEEDKKAAVAWWGGEDFPLALSPYKDTAECPGFIAKDVRGSNVAPFDDSEE